MLFPGEYAVDQASLLSALSVFLLSAGVDVCSPEPLHTLCLQRFTTAMDAKEPQVSPTATPAATKWPFVEAQLLISAEGCSVMIRSSLDSHFLHTNFSTHNSALKPEVLMNTDLSWFF